MCRNCRHLDECTIYHKVFSGFYGEWYLDSTILHLDVTLIYKVLHI